MKVQDWQLWLTYTTHLDHRVGLKNLARQCVEEGPFETAVTHEGNVHWKSKSGAAAAKLIMESESGLSRATIHFPDEMRGYPYALECSYQAMAMAYHERRAVSFDTRSETTWTRAFLGEVQVKHAGVTVRLYPMVRFYADGAFTVSFRLLSGTTPVAVEQLVEDYLNLYTAIFDEVMVPPPLLVSYADALLARERRRIRRSQHARIARDKFESVVRRSQQSDPSGDFKAGLASTKLLAGTEPKPRNLEGLFQLVATCAARLAHPREGHGFHAPYETWYGRPNVFLFEFDRQPMTTRGLRREHRAAFGKILARAPGADSAEAEKLASENLRPIFSDHAVYIGEAVTLVTYCKSGLGLKSPGSTANWGHLVYDRMVQFELLAYIEVLHRLLQNRLRVHGSSLAEIARDRLRLSQLSQPPLSRLFYYGDLNDMARQYIRKMGLDSAREEIATALNTKFEIHADLNARRLESIGLLIAVVFGIAAANPVGVPALKFFFPLVGLPTLPELYYRWIALTSILVGIIGAWFVVKARTRLEI